MTSSSSQQDDADEKYDGETGAGEALDKQKELREKEIAEYAFRQILTQVCKR